MDLKEAFSLIEKHELKVNTIICSVCGCIISENNDSKPCEHLKELARSMNGELH